MEEYSGLNCMLSSMSPKICRMINSYYWQSELPTLAPDAVKDYFVEVYCGRWSGQKFCAKCCVPGTYN